MGEGFGAEVINTKGNGACSGACENDSHEDKKITRMMNGVRNNGFMLF